MRVFVAGASGAVGQPLIRLLVESGHFVVGMIRADRGAERVRSLGATPVVVDALDTDAVRQAVERARPDAVINQLTSLPPQYSPQSMQEAAPNDSRVRLTGGANVLSAAIAAGAERYVVQSSGFWSEPGIGLADEDTPLAVDVDAPGVQASSRLFTTVETRTRAASGIETVILRYGFFYGPHTWYAANGDFVNAARGGHLPVAGNGTGVASFIHVEDAAAATVAALTGAPGTYNIVDSNPVRASVWMPAFARWANAPPPASVSVADAVPVLGPDYVYRCTRLRGASNAKARVTLDFSPRPLPWLQ